MIETIKNKIKKYEGLAAEMLVKNVEKDKKAKVAVSKFGFPETKPTVQRVISPQTNPRTTHNRNSIKTTGNRKSVDPDKTV